MKTKIRIALLAITWSAWLGLVGCAGSGKPDLDSDVEQLSKLPPATGAAIALRGPAYVLSIGIVLIGLNGIKIRVKHKRKANVESDES